VQLYLASTSPARLATLRAAGIEPVLLNPGVDEDAVAAAAGPLSPHDYVQLLARAKAEAVMGSTVDGAALDGFVLGGDSAFELDGVVYGKPHHPDVALERWRAMRGRVGLLHSGHWLIDHRGGTAGRGVGAVTTASVTFAEVSDDELEAYVATGEPLEVAGGFKIDARGGAFIVRVDGDPHAVVGLSVSTVRSLAAEFGVAWPAFWNRG
jgi:septum formation protein